MCRIGPLLVLIPWMLGGCGADDPGSGPDGPSIPASEFSVARPGDHSEEEARALAPDLSLVRTTTGFRGRLVLDPASAPRARSVEVLGAKGNVLAAGAAVAELPFDLPPGYEGPLTARVVYEDGEVWRFDTSL